MKSFFKKYKLLVMLLIYTFSVFLVLKFLFSPFLAKIGNISNEIQEKQIENKINRDRIGKIPEMETDWQSFSNNKEALDVILDKNEEVDFIKKLEAVAEETGNEISLRVLEKLDESSREAQRNRKIAEKKEEGEKTIEESIRYENYIILNINLRGGYSNLINFIKKVENTENYVNIISINSKKESLKDGGSKKIQSFDVFNPQNQEEEVVNEGDIRDELEKKELINSSMEVIVYVKK